MTTIVAVAALALLVLLLAALVVHLTMTLIRERDRSERTMRAREQEWRDERRELITRALRPDLVPVKRVPRPPGEQREAPRDIGELSRIGTVAPGSVAPDDETGE